ncbi:hypothetical protein B0T26DRAFT_755508 [Lasiosphaeria miniovina]|uniref:Uncharacterized protein n=1 Tax=Lasiosphaeria miniovina TaxID=1954250 RepID=A0AA40DN49_9PEZI|nr:uncharacterized protein B0T26DRAFT_755508 [Lasiosphaeria miniovina]KAK0705948.1 hypothetical protein B0T26DRAFT_755508 [Lasiosphaeria miniovina]
MGIIRPAPVKGKPNGFIVRSNDVPHGMYNAYHIEHDRANAPKFRYGEVQVPPPREWCYICSGNGRGGPRRCEFARARDRPRVRRPIAFREAGGVYPDDVPQEDVVEQPMGSETEEVDITFCNGGCEAGPVALRDVTPAPAPARRAKRLPKALAGPRGAIAEGQKLACDASALPVAAAWPRALQPVANGVTSEDKEVADLIRMGVIRRGDGDGEDIGMNCIPAPETPYTLRVVSGRRKGRRKAQDLQLGADWWTPDDESVLWDDGGWVSRLGSEASDLSSFVEVDSGFVGV